MDFLEKGSFIPASARGLRLTNLYYSDKRALKELNRINLTEANPSKRWPPVCLAKISIARVSRIRHAHLSSGLFSFF